MSFASRAISLALTTCLLLLGIVWQKFCKSPPAWLKGLHTLGHSRNQLLPGTVIVGGGSIAGMVTARICADHFERVIIIDPELEDPEKPRARIMQYHAAHVILTIFADGARRLWPEFDAEMKTVGGRACPGDFQIHYSGIPLLTPYKDYAAGEFPQTWVIRRMSSQKAIHRLFLRHPTTKKIKLVAGTIRGIRASEGRTHIESVDVRHLDGTNTSFRDAALVLDCTGNRQSGLKWLKAAGFTFSNDIRSSYDGNICYVTVCFTVSRELADKLPIPEAQRNTMLAYAYMPHEDMQSSCLASVLTDNNTSKRAFTLPIPARKNYHALQVKYSPLLPHFRYTTHRFILGAGADQSFVRYHSVPKGALPSNFIALGDATMQLNPMHGLFEPIFQEYLWVYAHLMITDRRVVSRWKGRARITVVSCGGSRISTASQPSQDDEVASAFWHIRHMLAADRALLAPTILWKILRTRSLFG
ncbi:hypothetical protein B0H16DRAFT_1480153 [Mycena metata]|uniref:FAD/NAD(P)-binding domain-containing protein n=1 Tax=Mycena metata TaxID=1033252 RepID=A0AAD7MDS4_9AGAR|nr:hypothetical protein B0H16DRAFT_1480153 [Mycena metata]